MTEADIDDRLEAMAELLEKVKALLAWDQLKKEEQRPDCPTYLSDPIDKDLRHFYGAFQMQALELRNLIDDRCYFIFSEDQREDHHRRFQQLDREMKKLELPVRFIKSPS